MPSAMNSEESAAAYTPGVAPIGQGRLLTKFDHSVVMELRYEVFRKLIRADFLYPEDRDEEFIESHLESAGVTVGVFYSGSLIAFANVSLPRGELIGSSWLGISGRPIHKHHAILMNCMVRPEFERCGLQKYLIDERLAVAASDNRTLVRVIASPGNHRSWGNLALKGFIVKGFVRPYDAKYGALLRYVLDLDIKQTVLGRKETSALCRSDDIERQEKCFAAGMLGFGRIMKEGVPHLELMQPMQRPVEV